MLLANRTSQEPSIHIHVQMNPDTVYSCNAEQLCWQIHYRLTREVMKTATKWDSATKNQVVMVLKLIFCLFVLVFTLSEMIAQRTFLPEIFESEVVCRHNLICCMHSCKLIDTSWSVTHYVPSIYMNTLCQSVD